MIIVVLARAVAWEALRDEVFVEEQDIQKVADEGLILTVADMRGYTNVNVHAHPDRRHCVACLLVGDGAQVRVNLIARRVKVGEVEYGSDDFEAGAVVLTYVARIDGVDSSYDLAGKGTCEGAVVCERPLGIIYLVVWANQMVARAAAACTREDIRPANQATDTGF